MYNYHRLIFREPLRFPPPLRWLEPYWMPDRLPLEDQVSLGYSLERLQLTKAMTKALTELDVRALGDLMVTAYRPPGLRSILAVTGLDRRLLVEHWTIRYTARRPFVILCALRESLALDELIQEELDARFGIDVWRRDFREQQLSAYQVRQVDAWAA